MEHNFSKGQQAAYDAVMRGENVYIAGSAGNGKSYLTRAITDERTVVCAPTGIAALNVEGMTCHKMFGLPIGLIEAKDWYTIPKMMKMLFSDDYVKRIIISEIGMVRADILTLIDKRLQKVKNNTLPFGGIQVACEGDFLQLEPIVSAAEQQQYYATYSSNYCFASPSWNFKTYELTEPQRHADPEQYALLNELRIGNKQVVSKLIEIAQDYDDVEDTINLCAYKKDADAINSMWYAKIKAPETEYRGFIEGTFKANDAPVGELVKLKVGARVLICANDIMADNYVNGDRGEVVRLNPNSVVVKLLDGREVVVQRTTWTNYEYKKVDGRLVKEISGKFSQIPLLLGWAISIHKCVAEDSLLETRSGKVRIADINIGDEIYSGFSYKKVVGKINSGLKQAKRLKTYGGLSLVCSEEHRILSCTAGGLPEYTELRDIKVGDYVATSYSVKEYLEQYKQIQIEHSPHSVEIIQPETLIPEDCYMLGALIGDGCYSVGNKDYRIDITSQDIEVLKSFESFTERFGINCNKSKPRKGNNNLRTYYTFSKGFYQWFESLGFTRVKAPEKFIPDVLKYSSLDNRKALVAGLIDTDGNISKIGSIRYVSSSNKLLKDFQDVLRSLGVFSYILKNTLTVSGNEAHRLGQMIDLKVKYKRDALALINGSIKTNFDSVPFAKHIKEYLRSKGISGIKTLPKGRVALIEWLKGLGVLEEVQLNFPLLSSEIMFLKVDTIIDEGVCNMYDIEVEDDHSFDTGGIIVHNCQGLTLDSASIDVGNGCFAAGQFYVAVSRVRNLKNLSFANPPSESDVIVRKEVLEFYRGVKHETI